MTPQKCEDIEHSEQSLPLSRTSEGDDSIQVFLTLACGAFSTHGRKFDFFERRSSCFAVPLFSHCTTSCLVLASTACLHTKVHVLLERPPRQKDVYPGQSSVESRLWSVAFGTPLNPLLLHPRVPSRLCSWILWLKGYRLFSFAVLQLATAQFSFFCLEVLNAVVPKPFQRDREFHPPPIAVAAVLILRFCRTHGNFCQQQAATASAKDCPGLVSIDRSLKALCPRGGVLGDYTTWNGHC